MFKGADVPVSFLEGFSVNRLIKGRLRVGKKLAWRSCYANKVINHMVEGIMS